jgi:hypothetical protein
MRTTVTRPRTADETETPESSPGSNDMSDEAYEYALHMTDFGRVADDAPTIEIHGSRS